MSFVFEYVEAHTSQSAKDFVCRETRHKTTEEQTKRENTTSSNTRYAMEKVERVSMDIVCMRSAQEGWHELGEREIDGETSKIEESERRERWIMKGFIIYCFHIETCHVYDITTNESLIEYKASVMNSTSGGSVITTSSNIHVSSSSSVCSCILSALFCCYLYTSLYSIIFHSLYYGDGGKKLWRRKGNEGRGRNPSSSCEKNSHTQFAFVG